MPRKGVSGCWWRNSRRHVGINAFDRHDDAGILIYPYEPHSLRTNFADIFRHLSPFTRWRPYEHRVRAGADGRLVAIPINLGTVNALCGLNLTGQQLEQFFELGAEKVARRGPWWTWSSTRSGVSSTTSSSAAIRASNGAWTQVSWTPA